MSLSRAWTSTRSDWPASAVAGASDALYTDLREMVAAERPDIVCVTTRTAERAEAVVALAEAGVKAIFATKPMSRTLAEAD